MKRPLLVAAVLAAAPLFATTAEATPDDMFNIVAPTAGVMTFAGTGTAQFNQNLGTNNAINLGSTTSLGVNASASSTEDYKSDGFAQLDLEDTSRMQHTIGTATTAFNTSTAAEASSQAAHVSAYEQANSSKYGHEWSSEYNSTYASETDAKYATDSSWELQVAGDSSQGYKRLKAGATGTAQDDYEYATEAEYTAASQASWKRGWESTYESAWSNTYSEAVQTATANAGSTGGTGIISATFSTTETGSGSTSASGRQAEFRAAAELAAEAAVGTKSDYSDYDSTTSTSANWEADYEAAYSAAYSSAYAAANAAGSRASNSDVSVTGIGSIADINSRDTSTFQAESVLIDEASRADSIGNGNASAGASLTSTSYANQTNGTTAGAFIQAFSGGGTGT